MELRDALLSRRSVRRFTPAEITDGELRLLLEAAMSGPSARNLRPWRFYCVRDRALLDALRASSPYSNMNGTLAILVCSDPERPSDFWTQDGSAATENILLQATSLGLGACWCAAYPREERVKSIQAALHLPPEVIPLNLIWIGHPESVPEMRTQYEESQVFHLD